MYHISPGAIGCYKIMTIEQYFPQKNLKSNNLIPHIRGNTVTWIWNKQDSRSSSGGVTIHISTVKTLESPTRINTVRLLDVEFPKLI